MTPPRLPRCLVLLATCNGARFVREQVESLAAQRGVLVEVLASDDGSRDETVALAESAAAATGLALRFTPSHPPTGSAARNFFHLLSRAEFDGADYVALCDQDDVWLADKLGRAVTMLAAEQADAYSCNSIAFWPDGRRIAIRKDYRQRRFDYLFESASHGCTYVLTASAAKRFAQFLAEREAFVKDVFFHDWLLYAWARSRGLRWVMDARHLIAYRQGTHNVAGANVGWQAARRRVAALRAGWLRTEAIKVAEAIGLAELPIVSSLRRFGWLDRCLLAARAWQCRRRPRDAIVFGLACLTVGV